MIYINKKVLLGTVGSGFVVANVSSDRGYFSVSFDNVEPVVVNHDYLEERAEDILYSMDNDYKMHLIEQYDAKPSELGDIIVDEALNIGDFSFFFDQYDIIGIDLINTDSEGEAIYFDLIGAGQGEYKEDLRNIVNEELANLVFYMWDEYHLKDLSEVPNEQMNLLNELIEDYEKDFDVESYIKGFLLISKNVNPI